MTLVKDFINSKVKLSSLKGKELRELIEDILRRPIEYRSLINLNQSTTIGMEIEYENADRNKLDSYIKKSKLSWNSKTDGSLRSGGEVTSPVMTNRLESWNEVKKICEFLKAHGAIANDRTGGHIHFGSSIFKDDYNKLARFQALFALYENILFRFASGEFDRLRNGQSRYATEINDECIPFYFDYPLTKSDFNIITETKDLPCSDERRQALNLTNVYIPYNMFRTKNTVEIRLPNGSVEETIWQNNISTFGSMLEYATSPDCDIELLDFKIKEQAENGFDPFIYEEVSLKDAIEFCDLVFNSNIDKVYFLRQYLKDFVTFEPKEEIQKIKRFVK